MASRKFLTISELTALMEDDEFLANIENEDHNHVNVAIIPPDTDELTDSEDIKENDLDENDINDIAGTFELFVPQREESQAEETSSSSAKKVKKQKRTIVRNRKDDDIKCQSISPTYTKTARSFKEKTEFVTKKLEKSSATEIFEYMFSDSVFQLIIEQSELYANQNNVTNFSLSLDDLKIFIGILLISGYHKLPQEDMYWEQAADVGVSIVFDSMPRNRFREIKRYIHLSDNCKLVKTDKFYKLRTFFDILKKNFSQFGIFSSMLSIDEMMVRYYGKHPTKMYMQGKPIKFGYKIWCLCSSSGYLYSFEPYGGKSDNINEGPLGSKVVKTLVDVIPPGTMEDHEVFFDNFFTSHGLLKDLGQVKLKATGTIRENRTKQCPLMPCKEIEKKKERGYHEMRFDKENEIQMVRWKDNKTVTMATNYSDALPLGNVKRFSRKDKQYVTVPIPRLFSEYNKNMGGVDLLDKQISLYRTRIRSKKW